MLAPVLAPGGLQPHPEPQEWGSWCVYPVLCLPASMTDTAIPNHGVPEHDGVGHLSSTWGPGGGARLAGPLGCGKVPQAAGSLGQGDLQPWIFKWKIGLLPIMTHRMWALVQILAAPVLV